MPILEYTGRAFPVLQAPAADAGRRSSPAGFRCRIAVATSPGILRRPRSFGFGQPEPLKKAPDTFSPEALEKVLTPFPPSDSQQSLARVGIRPSINQLHRPRS
jgi:hypothetical protein